MAVGTHAQQDLIRWKYLEIIKAEKVSIKCHVPNEYVITHFAYIDCTYIGKLSLHKALQCLSFYFFLDIPVFSNKPLIAWLGAKQTI